METLRTTFYADILITGDHINPASLNLSCSTIGNIRKPPCEKSVIEGINGRPPHDTKIKKTAISWGVAKSLQLIVISHLAVDKKKYWTFSVSSLGTSNHVSDTKPGIQSIIVQSSDISFSVI